MLIYDLSVIFHVFRLLGALYVKFMLWAPSYLKVTVHLQNCFSKAFLYRESSNGYLKEIRRNFEFRNKKFKMAD